MRLVVKPGDPVLDKASQSRSNGDRAQGDPKNLPDERRPECSLGARLSGEVADLRDLHVLAQKEADNVIQEPIPVPLVELQKHSLHRIPLVGNVVVLPGQMRVECEEHAVDVPGGCRAAKFLGPELQDELDAVRLLLAIRHEVPEPWLLQASLDLVPVLCDPELLQLLGPRAISVEVAALEKQRLDELRICQRDLAHVESRKDVDRSDRVVDLVPDDLDFVQEGALDVVEAVDPGLEPLADGLVRLPDVEEVDIVVARLLVQGL